MSEISNYDKVQNALKILNKKEINENDDSRSVCNTVSDGWMQENEDSGSGKSKTVQSEKSQIMEAVHIKEEALNESGVASDQTDDNEEADAFEASMDAPDDNEVGPAEDKAGETKAEPEAGDPKEGKGDDSGKGDASSSSNEGPSSDKNGDGDVDNYNNAQAATMVKALFDVILAAANADLKAQVKVDNGTGGGNTGTGSTETEVTELNNNGAANQTTSNANANANSTDTSTQTTNEVPTETPKENE